MAEENEILRRRLQHLLQSETVRMYDEIDPRTREYRRDIRQLDAVAGSTEGGLRCEKDMTIQEAIRRIRQHISVHHIGQPPHYYIGKALDMAIEALQEKALREKKKKQGVIKTAKNVKFDVIYDDGTRRHVTEGVLFEVENEQIVFHNGTDRLEVVAAACEAAAEVMGSIMLPRSVKETIIANVCDKIGFGVPEE